MQVGEIDKLFAGTTAGAVRGRRGSARFVLPEEEEPASTPRDISVPAPIVPLELPPPASPALGAAETDRRAAGQGAAMLKALAGLQLAGLNGQAGGLGSLAELASGLKQAADPKLQAVLQAIAARAAVELARQG